MLCGVGVVRGVEGDGGKGGWGREGGKWKGEEREYEAMGKSGGGEGIGRGGTGSQIRIYRWNPYTPIQSSTHSSAAPTPPFSPISPIPKEINPPHSKDHSTNSTRPAAHASPASP